VILTSGQLSDVYGSCCRRAWSLAASVAASGFRSSGQGLESGLGQRLQGLGASDHITVLDLAMAQLPAAERWSAAVLAFADPGRSSAASGSPVPAGPWSTKASSGWKPNVRLNVGAADPFSEWATTTVASRSTITSLPGIPVIGRRCAQDRARARARAERNPASAASTSPARPSMHRDTVGSEATAPNNRGLLAQHRDIGQAVAAESDAGRQVQHHLARIVAGAVPSPTR